MTDIKMETVGQLRVGKGLDVKPSDIKDDRHDPSLRYVENPQCKTKRELSAKIKEDNVNHVHNNS